MSLIDDQIAKFAPPMRSKKEIETFQTETSRSLSRGELVVRKGKVQVY
jgi:hypothetical protein